MSRRLSAVLWLIASIVLEATSVAVLAATVGWIGVTLYSDQPANWALFALLVALMVILRSLAAIAAGSFGAWLGTRYRRRALVAAMTASPDRIRSIGPGAALTKALDVESVGDFFARASAGWILGAVEVAVAIILVRVFALPGLLAASLTVSVVVVVALAAMLLQARARWRRARLETTARTVEGLLGLETIQVFGEPYEGRSNVASRLATYRKSASRMDAVAVLLTMMPGVALIAALILMNVDGVGSGGVAVWIGISLLAASGFERLTSIAVDAVATLDASQGLRELDSFAVKAASVSHFDVAVGQKRRSDTRSAGPFADSVLMHARGVTSTYSRDQGLIDSVDLVVNEGDRLLVSAPSGFGKTTFGEVLAGDRAPTEGEVWRRDGIVVARVLQADDDHMFGNSLMFNIACGVEWPAGPAVRSRVLGLLEELGLSELVSSMPAGVAQPIGEGGWRLSAGERTRVSVAAALLREPDVLILDESTATLDGETRERVLAACERHSRATVLFAHWD